MIHNSFHYVSKEISAANVDILTVEDSYETLLLNPNWYFTMIGEITVQINHISKKPH